MEAKIEMQEGSVAKLTVTVPAEDVDAAIDGAYKRISQQLNIPGFRKGKVPPKMIDQHIGEERVMAEAQESIVSDAYSDAIEKEELRPIDQPVMDALDLPVRGTDYTFEAEIPVRPEMTISSRDGISITVAPAELTETELDAELENIRAQHATLETADGAQVAADGFAVISFEGLIDGEPYEGNVVTKYLYELGQGQMPEEFESALVGAAAGDEVEASFEISAETSAPEYAGKQATFQITVEEVKERVLPELDDTLAEAAGFESLDDMRSSTRDRVQAFKSVSYSQSLETAARLALIERLDGDVPESMVRIRVNDMIRDFFSNLEGQGITPDQYTKARGIGLKDLEEEFEEGAQQAVASELALEALARDLGAEATDEDLLEEIERLVSDKASAPEMLEKYLAAGMGVVLREQVLQRKAMEWMLENIEINEAEPVEEAAADEPEPVEEAAADEAEPVEEDADPEGE